MRRKYDNEITPENRNNSIILNVDGRDYYSPLHGSTGEMAALYRVNIRSIVRANDAFCDHFGLNVHTLAEEPIPSSFREILSDKFSAITTDRPTVRTLERQESPGDKARWYEWTGRGFFTPGNSLDIIMIAGRDITEYGAALERVSEFDAYYQHFIECISDVVYFTDKNGIIRYISRVVEQVSQWKSEEVTGIHYMTFIHPDDVMPHIEYMKDVLNSETQRPFISRIRKKDGTYQYATLVSRRVINNGVVEGVVGIISHAATPISNEYRILKMLLYLLSGNERTVLIDRKSVV